VNAGVGTFTWPKVGTLRWPLTAGPALEFGTRMATASRLTTISLGEIESVLAFIVVLGAAIGVFYGAVRFVNGWRTRVSVSGSAEVIHEGPGRAYEAFVLYVRSSRDDPVSIEACGIVAQDTVGSYWRLGLVASSLPGQPVSRGLPFRWVMPFSDIAGWGLDPRKRVYGYARIAQPASTAWSRRMTAGPQRQNLARSLPTPRARPANQEPLPPPWWVRWLK